MGKQLAIQYAKRLKQLDHEIEIVTPGVYSSIAIAMHEAGIDNDAIADIFAESQRIWAEHSTNGTVDEMIEKCEQLTGIEMTSGGK